MADLLGSDWLRATGIIYTMLGQSLTTAIALPYQLLNSFYFIVFAPSWWFIQKLTAIEGWAGATTSIPPSCIHSSMCNRGRGTHLSFLTFHSTGSTLSFLPLQTLIPFLANLSGTTIHSIFTVSSIHSRRSHHTLSSFQTGITLFTPKQLSSIFIWLKLTVDCSWCSCQRNRWYWINFLPW